MDKRDEDFLKDLAWSEIWFPWRKKGILIRGSESRSPEAIALFISTLALVISGVATVGTWRQTDLMREQLTASDRNAGVVRITETMITACSKIRTGPIRTRQWKPYRNSAGLPAKVPIVDGAEYKISPKERQAYGNELEDLQGSLPVVGLYRGFLEPTKLYLFTVLLEDTNEALDRAIDLVDDTRVDLDYVQLRSVGDGCMTNMVNRAEEVAERRRLGKSDPLNGDDTVFKPGGELEPGAEPEGNVYGGGFLIPMPDSETSTAP